MRRSRFRQFLLLSVTLALALLIGPRRAAAAPLPQISEYYGSACNVTSAAIAHGYTGEVTPDGLLITLNSPTACASVVCPAVLSSIIPSFSVSGVSYSVAIATNPGGASVAPCAPSTTTCQMVGYQPGGGVWVENGLGSSGTSPLTVDRSYVTCAFSPGSVAPDHQVYIKGYQVKLTYVP